MHRSPKILHKFYSDRTWFRSSKETIYLTFDDGPCPGLTDWLLDLLKVERISATFFCVGENYLRYPELVDRILQEGHQLGNHTMRHENGFKVDTKAYYQSFLEGQSLMNTRLFRPPYGRMPKLFDKKMIDKVEIVMWTWLAKDYDVNLKPEKIIQAAEQIRAGDILVFHDNIKAESNLKESLPAIIHLLKRKGFEFSSL